MAKANLEGLPEPDSVWELEGVRVRVDGFEAKGRGGYVEWSANGVRNKTKLSEFRSKAKAA